MVRHYIDFHTHTFPEKIAAKALEQMSRACRASYFSDGTASGLVRDMKQYGVDLSVNLPVMTSPAQVEKVNSSMIAAGEALLAEGILTFGGMHPDYPEPVKELRRLKAAGIRGIKIHPAYQGADLDDPRYLKILDAAEEEGLIVITHAGLDIGIYDHNYASVKAVLHVLNTVRPERFVLAHMGGWGDWDAVEKDLAGAPVWLDTAFSLGPIQSRPSATEPPIRTENLNQADFTRLVRKHGAGRVLFATDSPWERAGLYKDFLQGTDLTAEEKEKIFHGNAEVLLQL